MKPLFEESEYPVFLCIYNLYFLVFLSKSQAISKSFQNNNLACILKFNLILPLKEHASYVTMTFNISKKDQLLDMKGLKLLSVAHFPKHD